MKARCPKNENHKEFITVAHISQDWKVDESGNFIEIVEDCCEVVHGPDIGNMWSCAICGEDAIIED